MQVTFDPKKCNTFFFFFFFFLNLINSSFEMDRAQDPENAAIFKQFEEACSDFQVKKTTRMNHKHVKLS